MPKRNLVFEFLNIKLQKQPTETKLRVFKYEVLSFDYIPKWEYLETYDD